MIFAINIEIAEINIASMTSNTYSEYGMLSLLLSARSSCI
jgi:hypothetical protein